MERSEREAGPDQRIHPATGPVGDLPRPDDALHPRLRFGGRRYFKYSLQTIPADGDPAGASLDRRLRDARSLPREEMAVGVGFYPTVSVDLAGRGDRLGNCLACPEEGESAQETDKVRGK